MPVYFSDTGRDRKYLLCIWPALFLEPTRLSVTCSYLWTGGESVQTWLGV